MSIILLTTLKYLKAIGRNKGRLGILILAPIIFFSFFGFIFNTGDNTIIRNIGVINNDQGALQSIESIIPTDYPVELRHNSLSSLYLDMMANHTTFLINTEIEVVIRFYDNLDDLIADTETSSISVGLVFDTDFTNSILAQINQIRGQPIFDVEMTNITVTTYGDTTTTNYQSGISLVQKSLTSFVSDFIGFEAQYGENPKGGYLSYETNTIQTEEFNQFSFFAAGFLVFLIILQSMTVASLLASEKSKQTIMRMKLGEIQAYELFAGYTLGQIIAFSLQFVISVFTLQFWGIDLTVTGWANVFLVSQMTNITIIGLSLIVATFVKSSEDAMTVAGIGSAPLGFLSGSFTPVPEVYIIKSINFQFWDLIPTYPASQAMTNIIFNHAKFTELLGYLTTLLIYGLAVFILGIVLFKKNVFDRDM